MRIETHWLNQNLRDGDSKRLQEKEDMPGTENVT